MSTYTIRTDSELVEGIRAGDEAAFTEAYNRYWEPLLALGYYFTRNKQEAEDVVHEVFTSLWVRKADLPIRSLKAYLATAVKFAVFKAIARDQKRRQMLQGLPPDTNTTRVEELLEERFLQEYLKGVVEQLPEKARLVFLYSREEALSVKEIATRLDLSPKAVEYHMTKALRSLKEALKKIKSLFI